MPASDPAALARAYYAAIDADDYDRLAGLLAPGFDHVRGDRAIEGRGAFVRFVRAERPEPDTDHVVTGVFEAADGVAVRGRLHRPNGSVWFVFVDSVEGGRLASLTTYSNDRVR